MIHVAMRACYKELSRKLDRVWRNFLSELNSIKSQAEFYQIADCKLVAAYYLARTSLIQWIAYENY